MSTQRTLGHSGLQVSLIGLGTNNFGGRLDLEASRRVIHKALDVGITLFDTADIYGNKGGSETILGNVLGARRKEVILATKFGHPMSETPPLKGASRNYIFQAVDASLRRLRTDWIDLYQIHTPDAETPIAETVQALADLVQAGKVRYIGLSNFTPAQMIEAQAVAGELKAPAFITSQDEYSLLQREPEQERAAVIQQQGLSLLPFFPLANGLLTGKYRPGQAAPEGSRLAGAPGLAERYLTEPKLQLADRLEQFARRHGHTLLELAFSWLAAHAFVDSIIAGASSAEQVALNAKAANWALTADELAEIDELSR